MSGTNEESSVTVECVLVRLTPRAALLDIDGEQVWCPLAAIDDVLASRQEGTRVSLEVATWKAREWGLA